MPDKKRTKDELIKSYALLHALGEAQGSYISDTDPNELFDKLLGKLLNITESEYGFIGQVLRNDKGEPYLKNFATTDISWNKETRNFYEKYKDTGLEFNNMDSLFGLVITSGEAVISNDPSKDDRGCGIPEGHPPLKAFLGLPCYILDKLVGMVAIANRPGGYDEGIIELLSPLLSTTANIIEAFRNDSKQKEAENTVKTERERLFSILDSFPGFVYLQAEDYTIPFANQKFIDHYGDPAGKNCYELMWDREAPCDECKTFDVFKTKKTLEWISDHPSRNRVYQVYDHPFVNTDGKFLVLELSIDITERMQAEEALSVHTKRLNRLSELSMMLSGDPGEVFERVVRMIAELLDVRVVCLSEIRGEELYFLSVYADGETFADAGHCALEITPCATVEEGKDLRVYDHVMEKFPKAAFLKDYKAYSYCGFPSLDNDGNVVAVTCLLDDKPHEFSEEDQRLLRVFGQRIAMELDRSKVMADKMKSEALLQSVIDNSTTVVYVKDTEGRYLLINKIYEELFHIKREAIIGKTAHDIFPEDMADAFRKNDLKVLEANEPIEFEEVAPHDDGPHTYLSVKFPLKDSNGNPYAVCGISTDITERKHMEADRLKMQKLESIGVLAGGIAHDFNNLLTGILGNISLSMTGLDPDDRTYKRLKEAERASFFARDLTQQLLTFSKGGAPIKETLPIEELIKEPAELVLRGSGKRCVFEITDGLPNVDVDKGQIGQVINNLVINADQAMPDGGVIKISATKETIETKDHLQLRDGDYIVVRVADEGTGISPEHIPKVFDPYFTTKEKGSGLGLASVYSIIKNHAGHIDLTSEAGKGTTFNIYLPVSENETSARAIKKDEEIKRGSGRVLIMDDEEIIRELLSEFLVQLGYETNSASDGLEAVKIYKEAKEAGSPFKAVIMDLTIQGGVGGKEAIKLLLEEDPKARVIVSSGYSNDPVVANYRDYGFSGYLNKPYKVPMLSRVLDTVINGPKD